MPSTSKRAIKSGERVSEVFIMVVEDKRLAGLERELGLPQVDANVRESVGLQENLPETMKDAMITFGTNYE